MSSGDKRSVATDALETLGTLIDDKQHRDAIHLAVEPVLAGEDLAPGQHIKIVKGVAFAVDTAAGHGIVDPFLTAGPRNGQRFWFVMYPRMVHSLRHVWTHPAFPDDLGADNTSSTITKEESQAWLLDFCNRSDCPGYATVMALLDGTLPSADPEYYSGGGELTENSLHFDGRDAHGEIPPEFWRHAENVLGKKLPHHPQQFSCSC